MSEGYSPHDAREARLWNYFTQQDDFWPIREWPLWAQEIATNAAIRDKKPANNHKTYRERYRIFLFWTFNGLNPQTAAGWLYMSDYKNGVALAGVYDHSAVAQVHGMIKQAHQGDLFTHREPRRWDEERQKWVGGMWDMILGRTD